MYIFSAHWYYKISIVSILILNKTLFDVIKETKLKYARLDIIRSLLFCDLISCKSTCCCKWIQGVKLVITGHKFICNAFSLHLNFEWKSWACVSDRNVIQIVEYQVWTCKLIITTRFPKPIHLLAWEEMWIA